MTDTDSLSICVLVDNPDSWIIPWANQLIEKLRNKHQALLVRKGSDIPCGDLCFLLGCANILKPQYLSRSKHNIVVHESDLPNGRGFSPLAWQILDGCNKIPVCLFEAVPELDAGPIYLREEIELNGTELLPEIRLKQGEMTLKLCLRFVDLWPNITPQPQKGQSSSWRKRTRVDDRLDPHQSIAAQFDHLRIVDNEKYPAWFELRGKRYTIKIYSYTED